MLQSIGLALVDCDIQSSLITFWESANRVQSSIVKDLDGLQESALSSLKGIFDLFVMSFKSRIWR